MLARVFDARLDNNFKGDRSPPLRWKLLIVASLIAAFVGAGTCFAARFFLLDPAGSVSSTGWIAAATLLVPLASTVYTGVFVYRHTARRRVLQVVLAVLLVALLTLSALLLGSILLGRRTPDLLPAPQKNVSNNVAPA